MTPEDRRQSEMELFQEYDEKLKCLAILDRQLLDAGERLTQLGRNLTSAVGVGQSTEIFKDLESLPSTLADYRETHTRCTNIYQSLTRYGNRPSLNGVSYPQR